MDSDADDAEELDRRHADIQLHHAVGGGSGRPGGTQSLAVDARRRRQQSVDPPDRELLLHGRDVACKQANN